MAMTNTTPQPEPPALVRGSRPVLTFYVDWYVADGTPRQRSFAEPQEALGFAEGLWECGFNSATLTMGEVAY